jgi:hypothetical protein
MTNDDPRSEDELAVAAHQFGRCEVCNYPLEFDQGTRDVYCPIAAQVHPDRPVRHPLPPNFAGHSGADADSGIP